MNSKFLFPLEIKKYFGEKKIFSRFEKLPVEKRFVNFCPVENSRYISGLKL